MPAINIVSEVPKAGRTLRRPTHTFYLATRPYVIQPFMIAPVLPGETLKGAVMQSRVVTDPVDSPLIGWWNEYYIFYVKLRDLDARDQITETMLTPGLVYNPGPTAGGVDDFRPTYEYNSSPMWVSQCLKRCVEEYFRDEGEGWNDGDYTLDGMPLASINQTHWIDSLKGASSVAVAQDQDFLPGQEVHEGGGVLPAHMVGWEAQFAQYEHMRALEMTAVTFEDWLRQFGVRAPKEVKESHKPELLRYIRDWKYPSNTIDPATGAATSAVSWPIAERIDKDRFFSEPGFIFGVTTTRTKINMAYQGEAGVGMLRDAFAFLPAILQHEPYTSLKKFSDQDGPFRNIAREDYWVDLRDLYLHGDQFWNFNGGAAEAANAHTLAMPEPLPNGTPGGFINKRFITGAMIDSFFKNAAANKVRQDGVINLNIASRLGPDQT